MPVAQMRMKYVGLGPKIGGSADSPRASWQVFVENIDPSYADDEVVDIVAKKVIEFVYPTVTYRVPNPTAETLHEFTKLYLISADPEMIDHDKAIVTVEWGLKKSSPMETVDPQTGEKKKPSEKGNDEEWGSEFSFTTRGGTAHITQAVFTRSGQRLNSAGGVVAAPDLRRAIGVSQDEVKGCDVPTGDLRWSITVHGLPVTNEYIHTLADLTGKVNRFEWFGRQREELLLEGVEGSVKAGNAWRVKFDFHEKVTQRNVEVIPGVVVPEIRGHDYVDVGLYVATTIGGFTVQTPTAVWVHQVIETRDFDRLLI